MSVIFRSVATLDSYPSVDHVTLQLTGYLSATFWGVNRKAVSSGSDDLIHQLCFGLLDMKGISV